MRKDDLSRKGLSEEEKSIEAKTNSSIERPAFLTGSAVYGKQGPHSDLDLVIYCGEDVESQLRLESNAKFPKIQYGFLNVITTTDPDQYDSWVYMTEVCRDRYMSEGRPIDKKEAMKVREDWCRDRNVPIVHAYPKADCVEF